MNEIQEIIFPLKLHIGLFSQISGWLSGNEGYWRKASCISVRQAYKPIFICLTLTWPHYLLQSVVNHPFFSFIGFAHRYYKQIGKEQHFVSSLIYCGIATCFGHQDWTVSGSFLFFPVQVGTICLQRSLHKYSSQMLMQVSHIFHLPSLEVWEYPWDDIIIKYTSMFLCVLIIVALCV